MDEYVFFDGRIVTADEAAISPVMSAALYGKGIFTTIAINNGELFLWEKHWRRLSDSADRVEIDLSEHSKETTKKAIEEILRRNELTQARVRLTFFDESSNNIWHREAKQKATLLITTGEKRQVNENFRLTISPYLINSLSPLAGIKSCNYLEKLMASNESKNRGFEEAVQVNERGETTSATMANAS